MPEYYNKFSNFLKLKYGEKVWKISLDAGFSCPNCTADGREGCIYCRNDSFSRQALNQNQTIATQMEKGRLFARERLGINKYLAYFQASTNTFASAAILEKYYNEALSFPDVVGISISTRPDCLPFNVIKLIKDLADRTDVWIELGLQSSHNQTLKLLNRGHSYDDFEDAVTELKKINVRICAHLILGLPGETPVDVCATAGKISGLGIDEIKLHPLLILKETALEQLFKTKKIESLLLDEYSALVVDFLEILPKTMVIQRLTAEAPKSMLIAPEWSMNKLAVLTAIDREFESRKSFQGKNCCSEGQS